jgi:hypothetical protein
VQFVENDEIEPLAIFDYLLIEAALPRHQELEHHEVRQQDVGRVAADSKTRASGR